MRVIAGRLGGRRFQAPPGQATRPTSERVREALFSMLGPLDDLRVLDLFAGSGALGIEALSRGAAAAVFVERDPRVARGLRANLEGLGLAGPAVRVVVADARTALRSASIAADPYDLVLLDPPYRLAPELGIELSEALVGLLAPGARVVTESDRRRRLQLDLPRTHDRRYGDTQLTIHTST